MSREWQASNQAYLIREVAAIKEELVAYVHKLEAGGTTARESGASQDESAAVRNDKSARDLGTADSVPDDDGPAPALDILSRAFHLSDFECAILLLCAGVELDSSFAALCAAAQGNTTRSYPTFSLALAALREPHWSALTPEGALRHWRLIEVGTGPAMTVSPLKIDERVLHFLAGISELDSRLSALVEPVATVATGDLARSHAAIAKRIIDTWSGVGMCVVQLCSADSTESRAIAAAAANAMQLHLFALPAESIPTNTSEFDAFVRLWTREALLLGAILLVECDPDAGPLDDSHTRAATKLLERLDGFVIVSTREAKRTTMRPSVPFDVSRPTTAEQQAAWQTALPGIADGRGTAVLAAQFNMSLRAIRSVGVKVAARARVVPGRNLIDLTWDQCRVHCRTRLEGLAQRIEATVGWDDLVLPAPQMQLLRQIATHVRHRTTVYDTWGFRGKSARGLGIAALFAGGSGTGKTLAAEILAGHLRLDLYRIDLAAMVSKYIGETEKNLRRVFDAAEESGAILLFDEADALFGKRSEVKDSHDRYANVEVSYLLQRIEAYRGLAILTTNLKSSIDQAFLRRLRFVVQFPMPDAAQRAEIWRRIFPKDTPVEDLDPLRLASANISGGNIRNIALTAAFLAAETGGRIRMSHLREAAQAEYAKLERPPTIAEIGSWV